MQTVMQAMLLSVQKTVVDRNIYAKAFIALPPNGESDAVSSVMQLNVLEDKAEEIFRKVQVDGIQLGEEVRLLTTVVRGAQNSVKQVVTGIERVSQRSSLSSQAPQAKQDQKA